MDDPHKDDVPNLSRPFSQSANNLMEPKIQKFTYESQSNSISVPVNFISSHENNTNLVRHYNSLWNERRTLAEANGNVNCELDSHFQQNQGASGCKALEKFSSVNGGNRNDWLDDKHAGRNDHLMRSSQLGMCNNSYCRTCPIFHDQTSNQANNSRISSLVNPELHNILYGDAKGFVARLSSFLHSHTPGVVSPHAKAVQQWNKFFVIACLMAIFVDPLFFFLLSAIKDPKCIVINLPARTTIVIFRSMTDLIYFLHILLQIMILIVIPKFLGSSGANFVQNILRISIIVQYLPRLCRFLPLLAGQNLNGFIFESAWANFVINLLIFMLSSHVEGSCWYLFGLQRVNQCLRDACHASGIKACMRFIDCGYGDAVESFVSDPTWNSWKNNENASACFQNDGFPYGIYAQAVDLTTDYEQITTLAGNQIPSYFIWEVLFTMAIIGLGILLFALLIGNMQNFLQALGQRRLEMSLRRRDFEQWMSHRRLPEELRRQVRKAERYNWAATRGVNEEMLLENLPEDLQREIRRHLFKFVKKIRIFAMMDDQVLDAFCERLKQKIDIEETKILYPGGPIEKMIFIVRGKVESVQDKTTVSLSEGDVCGEELLTWCLEHYSLSRSGTKVRIPGQGLLSNRTVRCLTNVEALALQAADLEEVTSCFARFLRNQHVQGAIRYESPYWRAFASRRIQVAWRYWKRRRTRAHVDTPESNH